ncbi:acyl-CoA thioesterase [Croceicoccus marinus]|uniref:Thioesterase n=1 Tax=Croceicoccus marinus TaxID=450378 RepID=A0A1Z1F9A0_9SPHN|nr:acyl-CoA thioesterase [Croceicoccus marinus]ARU15314.1 thioesterase [Croceicoccus marinus]
MSATPYSMPIVVDPSDIDFMGHVNNSRYLGWVQDVVLSHWKAHAPADAVASRLWVALKHEITYRRPAFLGDEVIAHTVLEKVRGARAYYSTIIERTLDKGAEILAEIESSWCCVDAESLRPARIGEQLQKTFNANMAAQPTGDQAG